MKLEYEKEVNEIVDLLLEKHLDTSREELNDQLKTGVENGFTVESQIKLLKHLML